MTSGTAEPLNPAAQGSHLCPHAQQRQLLSLIQLAPLPSLPAQPPRPALCLHRVSCSHHHTGTREPRPQRGRALGQVSPGPWLETLSVGHLRMQTFCRVACGRFPIAPMAPASSSHVTMIRGSFCTWPWPRPPPTRVPAGCCWLSLLLGLHCDFTLRSSILTTRHVWPPFGLCSAQHPTPVETPVEGTTDQS